ncbi:hypothetical protein TROLL_269 [Bacillus phage Troll]|uniref:Uncharacterized protein n=1 Tax=Bacillus phage Troll TaxID=1382932 RepID=S5Z827_9CAUD|nr:hypothetical protein TROLL_269 [Bacillus phage Troll]AGT13616.1 hypothetical protein TROLL_269 [Bacillus phage Troll]
MRDIEDIIEEIEIFVESLGVLQIDIKQATAFDEKEYLREEIEFVKDKLHDLRNELDKAEREEARRFNTANERAMSEAGHNERDFL